MTAVLMITAMFAAAAGGQDPDQPLKATTERADLPRVLLIGDSISIAYTVPVRQLLREEANVIRPLTNCGPTTRGLQHIDAWLGEGHWDVIHFNWGLHDLKHIGDKTDQIVPVDAADSHRQVSPQDYAVNLERLVKRLQQTGAKLIWCSTTPVPEGARGRLVGDSAKYNAIAAEIMQRHQIEVNDLYATASQRQAELQRTADVHFKPAGSKVLAEQVAASIRAALASP